MLRPYTLLLGQRLTDLLAATQKGCRTHRRSGPIGESRKDPRIAADSALRRLLGEGQAQAGGDDRQDVAHARLMRSTHGVVVVAEDDPEAHPIKRQSGVDVDEGTRTVLAARDREIRRPGPGR